MKNLKQPVAGSPQPIFIAGVRYESIFSASIDTDISSVWIFKMLKASGGFPVLIKRQMVATEWWVHQRVKDCMRSKNEC
jgi:hypothetical protein